MSKELKGKKHDFCKRNVLANIVAIASFCSSVSACAEEANVFTKTKDGLENTKAQEKNSEEEIKQHSKRNDDTRGKNYKKMDTTTISTVAGLGSLAAIGSNYLFNELPLNNQTKIKRTDIFEMITGVDEETFRNNEDIIKKCIQKDVNGNFYVVNYKTGVRTLAGKFRELSVKELDEKLQNYKWPGNGSFNIISLGQRYKFAPENLKKKVDISAMQANSANAGKVFVVASNFNVLETLGEWDDVSEKKIADYVYDHTQGPYAALSAVAGTIIRTYAMYYDETKPPKEWRQTTQKQINTLSALGIKAKNGYVIDDAETVYKKLNAGKAKEKFKIGYHKNVQVSGGCIDVSNGENNYAKQEYFNASSKIIDQVYLATIDLNSFDLEGDQEKRGEIAKTILEWDYEATIKSAIVNSKKEVILPLIGCGVFGNKPMWHVEAIKNNLDLIKKSGLKVTLNLFDAASYPSNKNICDEFKKLTTSSGGKFEVFI